MPNTGEDGFSDTIAPLLLLKTYQHEDIPVVSAQGDIDLSTAPNLWEALKLCAAGLCSRPEEIEIDENETIPLVRRIAVDLRRVVFIDSAGVALLVEARKRFTIPCQLILLVQSRSQPDRVLKLGRFDRLLSIVYSLENLPA